MSGERGAAGHLVTAVTLSACANAAIVAVPAAGALISSTVEQLDKAFLLKTWYHKNVTGEEAGTLLLEKGQPGSFLVRTSSSNPKNYVLVVRHWSRVKQLLIRSYGSKYEMEDGIKFDDLSDLILYYKLNPVRQSRYIYQLLEPMPPNYLEEDRPSSIADSGDEEEFVEMVRVEPSVLYKDEFVSLREETRGTMEIKCEEGKKRCNAWKNRYKNILPFDTSRVRICHDHGNDYINANFIEFSDDEDGQPSSASTASASSGGPSPKKIYIATQGCLDRTEDDFYHMLWQENVTVVVMLTKTVESGKVACSPYWPKLDEDKRTRCFHIRVLAENNYDSYVRRVLLVSQGAKHLFVTQYQYTVWPDHGTPCDANSILTLVQDINCELSVLSCGLSCKKICIHCSAGVGRTGTFIAIDHLISQLERNGADYDVNVRKTVAEARQQRAGMVNNLAQYCFIYEAISAYAPFIKTWKYPNRDH